MKEYVFEYWYTPNVGQAYYIAPRVIVSLAGIDVSKSILKQPDSMEFQWLD